MKNYRVKKELLIETLALGIVVLFIGTGVVSALDVNFDNKFKPVNNGNWLYVGGFGPDNYTRIQDAINDAVDGDTVFVYSGIYYENVFVNKSLTLRGEDKNTTIIDGAGDVGFNITINDTFINGFTIKNCTFGISLLHNSIEASNITISNNIIYDCGHGILLVNSTNTYILFNTIFNNSGNSIFIQKCNNSNITNNVFYNNSENGITIKKSSNCNIFLNDIYNNLDLGISIVDSSQNNSIFKNNINNNLNKGIYVSGFSSNNSFYHNNFINNSYNANDSCNNTWYNTTLLEGNYWDDYNGTDINNDGIGDIPYNISGGANQDLYPLIYPWNSTNPNAVYVDDDFNENTPGWGYNHFNKIQEGVDVVNQSGIVYIYNGTYYENVIVNKTVNLVGEEKNTTILDGNFKGSVIDINSDNVVVRGFTLKNIKDWQYFEGKYGCIKILGGKNVLITDNIITPGELGDHMYGEGVYLYGSGTSKNVIKDNIIFYDKYIGTAIGIKIVCGSHDNTVYNNEIYGCHAAVSIDPFGSDCKDNTIISNYLHNLNVGVSIAWGSPRIKVISNKIINCAMSGVFLFFSDDNLIDNNTITHNEVGIGLSGSGSNTNIVLNNQISYNNLGIEVDGRHNIIYHNNLENNTQNAYDQYDNYWDYGLTGNYWSDYEDKYPAAQKNQLRPWIWDTPYDIPGGNNKDRYPLIKHWSDPLLISITSSKAIDNPLLKFFENHPFLFRILQLFWKY